MSSNAAPGIDQGGHADTSCLLLARSGFSLLSLWTSMPRALTPVCDFIFVQGARRRGLRLVQGSKPTLFFTSRYAIHFQQAGRAPPAYATSP